MNRFNIRPVHFTIDISDRHHNALFIRNVLDMKILRHVELVGPVDTACPEQSAYRWCKTVIGYGPEISHFGVVLVYFYSDKNKFAEESIKLIGATIKSLPAIARAKAMGFPMLATDDKSFVVTSPSGLRYNLIDEYHHQHCDPFAEIYLKVTDLKASLEFWTEIMCVAVISKSNQEFTLFFGNNNVRVRYVKTDKEISDCRGGYMSYTAPMSSLEVIEERCPAECLIQPLCKTSHQGRDADHLMLIRVMIQKYFSMEHALAVTKLKIMIRNGKLSPLYADKL